MPKQRPVNLDLTKFSFPIMALVSITHRVTGVILFVGVAFALYALDQALASDAALAELKGTLASPLGKFVTFGILAATTYHVVAGVRHMLMDLGFAESISGGRASSVSVVGVSVVLIVLAGAWLW